jgi:hypothetical protein
VVADPTGHQATLEAMTARAGALGLHHTTIQIENRALSDCVAATV